MSHLGIEIVGWACTDVGKVRKNNEDAFLFSANDGLFAVADGMGGHAGGEVASRMVVELLRLAAAEVPDGRFLRDGSVAGREEILEWLHATLRDINLKVHVRSQSDPELRGMGCTLEVALFRANGVFIAHVGDSRTYMLRDDVLYLLTEDHTLERLLVSEQGLTPEAAARHPQKGALVRAIGPSPAVQVDTTYFEVGSGDVLLQCSDGLHGLVPDARIREVLRSGPPAKAAPALVSAALDAGGRDNVTPLVVAVERCSVSAPVMVGSQRALGVMRASALFAAFSEGELIRLQKVASARTFKAGAMMAAQGRVPSALYLTIEGTFSFLHDDQLVGSGGPGDHFGELGVVDAASAVAARADTDVLALEFPLPGLQELLRTDAPLAARLYHSVLRRLHARASGALESLTRYRRVYGPTPI
ncbi:MAG: protein phosphatase 2C domain-containing protein [Pseudomonadota bacterium]|nr:protein phosphatase 2C domain-containing protein [Pseudomonadota bacterium]